MAKRAREDEEDLPPPKVPKSDPQTALVKKDARKSPDAFVEALEATVGTGPLAGCTRLMLGMPSDGSGASRPLPSEKAYDLNNLTVSVAPGVFSLGQALWLREVLSPRVGAIEIAGPVTDRAVAVVLASIPNLQSLSLHRVDVRRAAGGAASVRWSDEGARQVSGSVLDALSGSEQRIRALSLHECTLDDQDIHALLETCPSLVRLTIDGFKKRRAGPPPTEKALAGLSSLKSLETLELLGLPWVRGERAAQFIAASETLEEVVLDGCSNVDVHFLARLVEGSASISGISAQRTSASASASASSRGLLACIEKCTGEGVRLDLRWSQVVGGDPVITRHPSLPVEIVICSEPQVEDVDKAELDYVAALLE